MKTTTIAALAVLGTASVGSAQVYLTTLGNTLYRTIGGATTEFTLSDDITSLEVMDDGTIYGASRTDDDNDGFFELYRLDGAEGGAPSLTLMGDFLANNTPSLMNVGGQLYGFQHTPGGVDNSDVVTIDPIGGTQASTGMISSRMNSTGYDDVNGEAWGMNRGNAVDSMLHSIDIGAPSSAGVGSVGIQTFNAGGDFWNGTLYRAFENRDTLRLATVNTLTGVQTPFLTLDTGVTNTGVGTVDVGLVIIPAPGVSALVGLAGLAAIRRRR